MTNKQKWYKQTIDELIAKGKGKIQYLETKEIVHFTEIPVLDGERKAGVGMVFDRDGKLKRYCLYGFIARGENRGHFESLSTRKWKRFEHELRKIRDRVRFEELFPEEAEKNKEEIHKELKELGLR